MADKLKKEDFIPPGFELSKYDQAKNMDLFSWFTNIFARTIGGNSEHQILHFINNGAIIFDVSDDERVKNYLNNVSKGDLKVDDIPRIAVVRDLSVFDVMMNVDSMPYRDNYEDIKSLYDTCMNSASGRKEAQKVITQIQASDGSDAWINIDMSCSDSEIKNSFQFWLKSTRKKELTKSKPKKRERKMKEFNEVVFRNWEAKKILPYIDLVNWNKLKGNKYTSEVLGEILFPKQAGSTATINDTVKPLAEQLMSNKMIDRMMAVLHDMDRGKIASLIP